MTSRKSFFNFEIMAESVKQSKYIMILHTIALFLMTTIPVYMELQNYAEQDRYSWLGEELSMWLSGFNPIVGLAAIGIPIITVIYLFSYLFKPNSVQFFNSMPYTRGCMYISRFAACAVSVVLPILLVFAVNSVVYVVMGLGEYFPYADMTAGLGTMLICYFAMLCLCVFAVSLAGNFFAALIVAGFTGLAYIVTTLAITVSCEEWFNNLSITFNYELAYIFPPALLFYRGLNAESSISAAIYIYSAVYAVFFLALGLWAYVKRRGENTNKFFAYKGVGIFLKYFVSLVGSMFFGSLFLGLSRGNIAVGYIGYMLILFIVYVMLQAIFEKDMRGMFSNMKHFAVFAVIWAIVLIPLNMGVLENIEPMRSGCNAIRVQYGVRDEILRDSGNVDAAFELYGSAERKNDDGERYRTVTFTFNPGNPVFKIERTKYVYSYDEMRQYEKAVFNSEEYKSMLLEALDKESSYAYIELSQRSYHVIDDREAADYDYDYESGAITKGNFNSLKEILKSDIAKYDYDTCTESGCFANICLRYSTPDSFGNTYVPVYLCYEETVRFMKENMGIRSESFSREGTTVYVKIDDYCIFETEDPEEIEALFDCSAISGYGCFFPMRIEVSYNSTGESISVSTSYENLSEEVRKMINPEGAEYEDIPKLELNTAAQ